MSNQTRTGQTSPSSTVSRDSVSPPSSQPLQARPQHLTSQMGCGGQQTSGAPPSHHNQQQHHMPLTDISTDSPEAINLQTNGATDLSYPSPTITPANESSAGYNPINGGFWTPLNRDVGSASSLVMQVKAENLSTSQQVASLAAVAAHHSAPHHHYHHHSSYGANPYYPGMDLSYFGGQSLNHQYASHMSSTASMFRSAAGMAEPYDAYTAADRYQLL